MRQLLFLLEADSFTLLVSRSAKSSAARQGGGRAETSPEFDSGNEENLRDWEHAWIDLGGEG